MFNKKEDYVLQNLSSNAIQDNSTHLASWFSSNTFFYVFSDSSIKYVLYFKTAEGGHRLSVCSLANLA